MRAFKDAITGGHEEQDEEPGHLSAAERDEEREKLAQEGASSRGSGRSSLATGRSWLGAPS
jgi:hypothetical protein